MTRTQQSLLQGSAEWRLIALLFECPLGDWRRKVAALASEVTDADLRVAAEAAQTEAQEGLYHSIFGPGGPVSPREVSYQSLIQLGSLMSELNSYYDAFAYQPATQEPGDHVSVEAGFIAYLRLKEAYALACSDTERAGLTSNAAQRFIEDHLSALGEPLARVLAESGVPYLVTASQGLLRRCGPCKNIHSVLQAEDCLSGCGEI